MRPLSLARLACGCSSPRPAIDSPWPRLARPRVAPSLSHEPRGGKTAEQVPAVAEAHPRTRRIRRPSARLAPDPAGRIREPREREAVEARNERVRRPGPGRDDGDPRSPGCDGRDPREEAVDLGARDKKGDRPRDVAPAPWRPVAPALDPRLRHESLGELPELDDAGRAVGALAARPLDRVSTMQTQ